VGVWGEVWVRAGGCVDVGLSSSGLRAWIASTRALSLEQQVASASIASHPRPSQPNPTHLPLSCTLNPRSLRCAAAVASPMAPLTAPQSAATSMMPFLPGRASPSFCGGGARWVELRVALQSCGSECERRLLHVAHNTSLPSNRSRTSSLASKHPP